MSTILITGGAGYIGSHISKELLRQAVSPLLPITSRQAIEKQLSVPDL